MKVVEGLALGDKSGTIQSPAGPQTCSKSLSMDVGNYAGRQSRVEKTYPPIIDENPSERVEHTCIEFDEKPGKDYFQFMSQSADRLEQEIKSLPDVEKLRLVDAILADLDRPDPEIDRVWAEEARKRWAAYRAGGVQTVSYEDAMLKYRDQ